MDCGSYLFTHFLFLFSFFEPLPKDDISFGIRHFAGRVVYDASVFVRSNLDQLSDDIVCVFARQSCNFGFVSHLFTQEVKMTSSKLFCLTHSLTKSVFGVTNKTRLKPVSSATETS